MSLSMYIYTYINVNMYIYIYTYIHIHTYIHIYIYIYIVCVTYINIISIIFHSQLELHTALPALRPGTARYAAWQRRSTDLGAAPGERRHALPCGDPRDLGGAWSDRGTSKHGGLTIKNGDLTIKNGSLTSNKCGLTGKHGDLTSKSCN